MGNNLGLFANPVESRRMAGSLDRLISSGGSVLGVCLDAYSTTNEDHLIFHRRNRERLGGQLRLRSRFEGLASPWFDYLMVSTDEFSQLLMGTPWRVTEVFRDGANYGLELRRR